MRPGSLVFSEIAPLPMLMPASSEFIALCRAQIALLTQALGASLSVVYLTEELSSALSTTLTPVAAHPEAAASLAVEQVQSVLRSPSRSISGQLQLKGAATPGEAGVELPARPPADCDPDSPFPGVDTSFPQRQMILPLVHEGVMMGLLITTRTDRDWSSAEQQQIEDIAATLSLACLLDQRSQWVEHDLRRQQILRARQHDILDDLLHQFRNPLTALRTFGKLLLKRLHPGDPNRDVAQSIVRESDRLKELLEQFDRAIDLRVEDVLPRLEGTSAIDLEAEIASLPLDRFPALPGTTFLTGTLHLEPYRWSDIFSPLVDGVRAMAQDRSIRLQVQIPNRLPPVWADLKAVREVLSNLIDNALKYTPAGGYVYVWAGDRTLTEQGPLQAWGIADTGPGIPPEDLQHLFERHYRGVQSQSDIPGTGLGLAIARDLMTQMNGDIQVYSPAHTCTLVTQFYPAYHGAGTAVIVWLPEGLL